MRKLACLVVAAGASLAGTALAMKPGLWEITTQMSGGGMPAMPAMSDAQRKQMEGASRCPVPPAGP